MCTGGGERGEGVCGGVGGVMQDGCRMWQRGACRQQQMGIPDNDSEATILAPTAA